MPSTSSRQKKFMAAAAHDPGFARRAGISQSVARDFARHDGTYRKAAGGSVMLGNAFGNLVAPQGAGALSDGPLKSVEPIKPISPGTLSPPDNVFAPQLPTPQPQMPYMDMHGGGGGGMARGGALRFEEGGEVDGGDPSAGGGAPGQDAGFGGYGGALAGALDGGGYGLEGIDAPLDFGAPTHNTQVERGLIGLIGSLVGLPGLGLAASLAERAADFAEARGIATDRDPVMGISAGGTQGALAGPQGNVELGHFGPDVPLQGGASARDLGIQPGAQQGALTEPGEALPALSTALPALRLAQPIINPLTYGYGPAAGWLR